MVAVIVMPYACAVRVHGQALLAASLIAVASFTGCPPASSGPSIARLPTLTSPDPQAETELQAARALEANGERDAAKARYERFLVERPKDPLVPVAQLALGRILLGLDKPREARLLFDSVATHPNGAVAEQGRFLGAVAAQRLGEHARAAAVLKPMVGRTIDPSDTQLLTETLASAQLALEHYAEAVRVLDRGCAALSGEPRRLATARIASLVQEKARAADVEALYEDLPEEGCAWPAVTRRAVFDADARGDADEARDLLEVMREHELPIDDELARIAMRADRPEEADPRVVGAVLSLSGKGRRVGELALRGLMLAAGLPPSGPLPKDAPQLIFRDDGGDPKRAAEAVVELATIHRAIAIIGPLDVRVAAAAGEQAQALGVPLVLLTPAGALNGSVVHRFFPTPEAEMAALLARVRADGGHKVAALLPQGPYGDAMDAALRKAASERGLSVTATQRYPMGATAFGTEVEALARVPFDALLIADAPGTVASLAPALAAGGLWSAAPGQAAAAGARAVRILSVSAAFDADLARTVGRYLQGALFSVPFDAASATGDAATFAQAFQARFGEPADTYAAFAHDAYKWVRAGVAAGGTTRATLPAALMRAEPVKAASPVSGFLPTRDARDATRLLELRGASFAPL
jgi:ABC-type branched-subunit amino acid transport system substrate-binding protein